MSKTKKKLLVCTAGLVVSLILAAIADRLYCYPWLCETSQLYMWPAVTAGIVGGFSIIGVFVQVAGWWEDS